MLKKGLVFEMNRYLKDFLHRGLMFGGFGPIVMGIIYLVLSKTVADFELTAVQVFLAVLTTYSMAFIQAGATVFNSIEHWSVPKSLLCHFSLLYAVYSIAYVANSWIPFDVKVLIVFSVIFIAVYFGVWLTVYFSLKAASNRMNKKLKS